ncbi:MAG: ribokinase [Pseudomonadota bacterium]
MRVFVLGALHLDVVLRAPHLPRMDETVVGQSVTYVVGGKGGNQAMAAARHHAPTTMAGRVGDDDFADRIMDGLRMAGVETGQIKSGPGPSGMSVAIVQNDGRYGAAIVSAANLRIDPAMITIPADTGLILLQNEIPEAANLQIAREARSRGIPVILNAAPARPIAPELRTALSVLVVNRVEAEDITGVHITTSEGADAAARTLAQGHEVILTLGAEGVIHATSETVTHYPAHPVQARSTHGAGDAFLGAYAARYVIDGADGADALAYAQAAAALHVSRSDPADVTPDDVRAFIR